LAGIVKDIPLISGSGMKHFLANQTSNLLSMKISGKEVPELPDVPKNASVTLM
jgi:hypothetical protein